MYRLINETDLNKFAEKYPDVKEVAKNCPLSILAITDNDIRQGVDTENLSNYNNLSDKDLEMIEQKTLRYLADNSSPLLDNVYYRALDDVLDDYYNVFYDIEKEYNTTVKHIQDKLGIKIDSSDVKTIYKNNNIGLYVLYNYFICLIRYVDCESEVCKLNTDSGYKYSCIQNDKSITMLLHGENKIDKWYTIDINTGNVYDIPTLSKINGTKK